MTGDESGVWQSLERLIRSRAAEAARGARQRVLDEIPARVIVEALLEQVGPDEACRRLALPRVSTANELRQLANKLDGGPDASGFDAIGQGSDGSRAHNCRTPFEWSMLFHAHASF